MATFSRSGLITPPTQQRTFAHVTLRVGCVVVAAAAGWFPDRDAVADGDLLGADEDVLDDGAQDALAVLDGGGGGAAAEPAEEALEVAGEPEVGVAVGRLGVEGGDLVLQAGLAGAEGGHAGAELVDGDELLGERGDHRGDRLAGLGEGLLELAALAGDRVGCAGPFQPFADLGADEGGVGEQGGDVVPDDLVGVVGADGLVLADASALVTVVVGAEAPVVVDLVPRGRGRGGAVVAVAAGRAGGDALQQGRDLRVPRGEPLVVGQPLLHPVEGLLVHQGGDRDSGPFLAGPVLRPDLPRDGAAGEAGGAVQPGRLVDDLGLAENRGAGVGGVAEHAPDDGPVPPLLAGAGGEALGGEPAAEVGDGGAVVGVAAEHLGDQGGLVRDDLVAGPGLGGLADVAVAERGAGQHVDAAGLRAVRLAPPVALHDLGLLILGEHALELDEQLVLGAVAARPLHELHPGPAAGELLDQQRLVGELAGQPVRGVDEDHVQAALGGQVPHSLQARAGQRRAGVPVVGEHPLLRDLKPAGRGVLAERGQLGADRLVLRLPGAGDPRVDRRCRHRFLLPLPGRRSWPAAAAPISRRPLTFRPPRDGCRRIPPPPAAPSSRRAVPVSAAEELLQGLRGDRRDGAARRPGVVPDRGGQPAGQPDGEHGALLRDRDPARRSGLADVAARLPLRAAQPPGQHPGRLSRRDPGFQQPGSLVDMLSVLRGIRAAIPRHDMKILQIMSKGRQKTAARPAIPLTSPAPPASPAARRSPATLHPPVTQRGLEAEIAHCVGGVITPPWGVPSPVGANPLPASNTPAFSQSRIMSLAGNEPSAASSRWWSILSNAAARSASRTHARWDLRPLQTGKIASIASWHPRPGRNPYDLGSNLASHSGSSALRTLAWWHRSISTGIPSGRSFARFDAFGIYTRRTARGDHDETERCTRTATSALASEVSATSPSIPAVLRPALRCVTCLTLTSVLARLRSISFCRFLTLGQSCSCAALKIRCRSRLTCSS
jgi:hypothetical protein